MLLPVLLKKVFKCRPIVCHINNHIHNICQSTLYLSELFLCTGIKKHIEKAFGSCFVKDLANPSQMQILLILFFVEPSIVQSFSVLLMMAMLFTGVLKYPFVIKYVQYMSVIVWLSRIVFSMIYEIEAQIWLNCMLLLLENCDPLPTEMLTSLLKPLITYAVLSPSYIITILHAIMQFHQTSW